MKTFLQGLAVLALFMAFNALFAGLVLLFGKGAQATIGEHDTVWFGLLIGVPALAITLWVAYRLIGRRPRKTASGRA